MRSPPRSAMREDIPTENDENENSEESRDEAIESEISPPETEQVLSSAGDVGNLDDLSEYKRIRANNIREREELLKNLSIENEKESLKANY